MASAWGLSFGKAWGQAWGGLLAVPAPAPAPSTDSGGYVTPRRRSTRLQITPRQRHEEDEAILLAILH